MESFYVMAVSVKQCHSAAAAICALATRNKQHMPVGKKLKLAQNMRWRLTMETKTIPSCVQFAGWREGEKGIRFVNSALAGFPWPS